MKIGRWYENGSRVAAAGATALVMAWCGSASAQGTPLTITVDENCIAANVFCSFAPDPGPGGLSSALTYMLPGPLVATAGDVTLTDAGLGDVIRFNLPGFGHIGGHLVFYSDTVGGVDALADIGLPGAFYTNLVSIPEVGPEGNDGATYTPTEGQPGFIQFFAVTYDIRSDSAPEPATLALLALGLAGLGFSRRKLN